MARIANQATLFLMACLFMNTEYHVNVHAMPTSRPPVPPTNTSSLVLVIPGECEVFPPGECQHFTSNECENDQQCQDIYLDYPGLKCCENYCGIRVCDLPLKIPAINVITYEIKEVVYTEFVCPEVIPQPECPLEADLDNECDQDNECSAGYKCCTDFCGERFCEMPVSRVVTQLSTGPLEDPKLSLG